MLLKFQYCIKNYDFQCIGNIFCVEFQRVPMIFHTKYLTHTLKYVEFIHSVKSKSSCIYEYISFFETSLRFVALAHSFTYAHTISTFRKLYFCVLNWAVLHKWSWFVYKNKWRWLFPQTLCKAPQIIDIDFIASGRKYFIVMALKSQSS